MLENQSQNNFNILFTGRIGKLGLKINGGRDRPVVPGDPGIFITAVKRGSLLKRVIGPGDKILKVGIFPERNASFFSIFNKIKML